MNHVLNPDICRRRHIRCRGREISSSAFVCLASKIHIFKILLCGLDVFFFGRLYFGDIYSFKETAFFFICADIGLYDTYKEHHSCVLCNLFGTKISFPRKDPQTNLQFIFHHLILAIDRPDFDNFGRNCISNISALIL